MPPPSPTGPLGEPPKLCSQLWAMVCSQPRLGVPQEAWQEVPAACSHRVGCRLAPPWQPPAGEAEAVTPRPWAGRPHLGTGPQPSSLPPGVAGVQGERVEGVPFLLEHTLGPKSQAECGDCCPPWGRDAVQQAGEKEVEASGQGGRKAQLSSVSGTTGHGGTFSKQAVGAAGGRTRLGTPPGPLSMSCRMRAFPGPGDPDGVVQPSLRDTGPAVWHGLACCEEG